MAKTNKILSRQEFEKLTETQSKQIALKTITHNGYNAYIANSDNGSFIETNCNVYHNGKRIDYLTYPDYVVSIKNNLKKYSKYILRQLKTHTFTAIQLKTIKDYSDYKNKRDFVCNIMPQTFDSVSIFDAKEADSEHTFRGLMHLFKNREDASKCSQAYAKLANLFEKAIDTDIKMFESAVVYEMFNHETPIDWDGWAPALNALGITYEQCDEKHKEAIQRAYKKVCNACDW